MRTRSFLQLRELGLIIKSREARLEAKLSKLHAEMASYSEHLTDLVRKNEELAIERSRHNISNSLHGVTQLRGSNLHSAAQRLRKINSAIDDGQYRQHELEKKLSEHRTMIEVCQKELFQTRRRIIKLQELQELQR